MKLSRGKKKAPLHMRDMDDPTPKPAAASRSKLAKKGGKKARLRLRGNY